MFRKIFMFAVLPVIFMAILAVIAAAPATASNPVKTSTSAEAIDDKAPVVTAKPEEEKTESAVPAPNSDLLEFIGKYHQDLLNAAATGDNAYIASFDGKLSDFISDAGYRVFGTALRKNPYGTVVHINSFIISGEPVEADMDVLVYMEDYSPETKLDLTIYPTALLITDSSETLNIYAVDSLSAYKACCASLNEQLDSAASIADLKRQTADAQTQAAIARQQAEQAQQQAYMAKLQAQQAEADAQQQANDAALQNYYNYYNGLNNGYYYNRGYYGGGWPIIVYPWNNNRPPFPRPGPGPNPRPQPCPGPQPGPHPGPKPGPGPRPAPRPEPGPISRSKSASWSPSHGLNVRSTVKTTSSPRISAPAARPNLSSKLSFMGRSVQMQGSTGIGMMGASTVRVK